MRRNEINQRLLELIVESGDERFRIYETEKVEDELLTDLGLDSMGLLQLMVAIECEFGIEWRMERISHGTLSTLNTISGFLLSEMQKAAIQHYHPQKEVLLNESYFVNLPKQALGRQRLSVSNGR